MTGRYPQRGDIQGAAEAGRRLLEEAVDAGIKRAQGPTTKPTLRRYSWSRLHTDLLDDNRWALVAVRAEAPLPIVEALVARLEIHANKSSPRGYVGDFDAEAMAARWNVDADMVGRILDELESSRIGWVDQDQIVTFWDRNPDKIDETAAERQRRSYHRKRGVKLLASLARQARITDQLRLEREVALREARDPQALIATWPEASVTGSVSLTRETVRLTPRAEQIIKQDATKNVAAVTTLGGIGGSPGPIQFAGAAEALQWVKREGEALVAERALTLRGTACGLIGRWSKKLRHDVTVLAEILQVTAMGPARGEAFRQLVENAVARRAAGKDEPALPFPPAQVKGGDP